MSDGGKSAFVPGFQYDVFISYAWVNNYPEQDGKPETGWVSQFKTKLQQRIDERLGRTGAARLFFDRTRLGKNQDFDPQIEAAVRGSAVFVAMFSDGYIQSPGCCQEIALFNDAGGGDLARSGRLFLARIDHVDPETWPAEFHRYLENVIGYEFFVLDPNSQKPRRVDVQHEVFRGRMAELRWDLSEKLKQLRKDRKTEGLDSQQPDVASARPAEPRPTVLVAQSTADLRKQRKQLITYCESAELRVLGVNPYRSGADDFRSDFLADLKESHLFVQLLSECYSDRTDEFPQGKEAWQLEQARQTDAAIVQWRDAALLLDEIDDRQHRDLVCHPDVRTDPPAALHKDVVERARRAFDAGKTPVAGGDSRIALIKYSEPDQQPMREMLETLRQANVVCVSACNGLPIVDRLREFPFDALIVVLGDCPLDWLEKQGHELLAVQLNFKDQAPLQAYYCCGASTIVPPVLGPRTLEISGHDQLDRLVQAIHAGGGVS
jgi:hypothetical protein